MTKNLKANFRRDASHASHRPSLALTLAAALALLAVFGEEPQEVSARAELATRSAFVDYGLMVGRDPVFVPAGRVTWGGWFLDAFSVIDYTDGDGKRTAGCFGSFDSAGLMDATIRADIAYAVTDWLTFSAFIAYHDFWYGDGMREAAADFNGRHGHDARTWNFSAGVGISATF